MSEATHLSSLAMRDSIHDFKDVATQLYHIIAESLPGDIEEIKTDKEALDYVFIRSQNTFEILDVSTPNTAFRQLGGDSNKPIAILCDASMCADFVKSKLINNTIGKVIVLRNREETNDGGTNCTNDTFRKSKVPIAIDASNNPIYYPKYLPLGYITTKFCSNHDITLNKESIEIDDEIYNFSENTVTQLNNKLEEYKPYTDFNLHDSYYRTIISHKFVQKRSGDFLQVLSCTDLNRPYKIDDTNINLKDYTVYFCSTDQVPISYCLYLGINCIFKTFNGKESIFKFYYNKDMNWATQSSKIYSELLANKSSVDTIIRESITLYDKFEPIIRNEMNKISLASNIEDIRTCVKYALIYYDLIDCYITVRDSELIQMFLNSSDAITEYSDKQYLVNTIKRIKRYNDLWRNYTIHTPIKESKLFPNFDPTTYFVRKGNGEQYRNYGMVYGQAILYMLTNGKNAHLLQFIKECINQILSHISIENEEEQLAFYLHYQVFSERLIEKTDSSGMLRGGVKLTKNHATIICGHLLHHLNNTKEQHALAHISIVLHSIELPTYSVCTEIIEYIIQTYKIQYMPYLEWLYKCATYNDLTERQKNILLFLKTPNANYRQSMKNKNYLMYIKAGGKKKTQKRIRRNSSNQFKNYKHKSDTNHCH